MHGFWRCALYLAALGVAAHPLGQALPRKWFCAEKAPWRSAPWEKGGRIYLKLGIRKWKDHLPDMSRLMPDMSRLLGDMVKKQLAPDGKTDYALLVQETCVAECVHWALTLLSAGIFFLWRSGWAVLLWLVYNVLGNVSFIVIQRYNRPRLQKLAEKTRRKPV